MFRVPAVFGLQFSNTDFVFRGVLLAVICLASVGFVFLTV